MHRRAAGLVLIAAMVLVAGACSSDEPSAVSTGTPTTGTPTAAGSPSASPSLNDHGTRSVAGMQKLSLELDDFYFEPTTLTGTSGQKLELELENESSALHSFTIDEQSIDTDVEAGKKGSAMVTFPASGSVVFYCKYHRSAGMQGALVTS